MNYYSRDDGDNDQQVRIQVHDVMGYQHGQHLARPPTCNYYLDPYLYSYMSFSMHLSDEMHDSLFRRPLHLLQDSPGAPPPHPS